MENFEILSDNALFKGIAKADIKNALKCLNAKVVSYKKNTSIYNIGDEIKFIGIVLKGGVYIIKYDFFGHSNIIQNIGVGGLFAEAYAYQKVPSLVNVLSSEESEILFVDTGKILEFCPSYCEFHQILIKNLFHIITEKNLNLIGKIECITPRSIREKILTYLSFEAQKHKKSEFDIQFNRQELADYLLVDRSALSNELSKMQKEGIIEYRKNHFIIIKFL